MPGDSLGQSSLVGDYSRTESVTAKGLSTQTTMPHPPRVSARMILGKKSVAAPEALALRETRGISSPIGEETANDNYSEAVSHTSDELLSLCFQSYSKTRSEAHSIKPHFEPLFLPRG